MPFTGSRKGFFICQNSDIQIQCGTKLIIRESFMDLLNDLHEQTVPVLDAEIEYDIEIHDLVGLVEIEPMQL